MTRLVLALLPAASTFILLPWRLAFIRQRREKIAEPNPLLCGTIFGPEENVSSHNLLGSDGPQARQAETEHAAHPGSLHSSDGDVVEDFVLELYWEIVDWCGWGIWLCSGKKEFNYVFRRGGECVEQGEGLGACYVRSCRV